MALPSPPTIHRVRGSGSRAEHAEPTGATKERREASLPAWAERSGPLTRRHPVVPGWEPTAAKRPKKACRRSRLRFTPCYHQSLFSDPIHPGGSRHRVPLSRTRLSRLSRVGVARHHPASRPSRRWRLGPYPGTEGGPHLTGVRRWTYFPSDRERAHRWGEVSRLAGFSAGFPRHSSRRFAPPSACGESRPQSPRRPAVARCCDTRSCTRRRSGPRVRSS